MSGPPSARLERLYFRTTSVPFAQGGWNALKGQNHGDIIVDKKRTGACQPCSDSIFQPSSSPHEGGNRKKPALQASFCFREADRPIVWAGDLLPFL